MAPAVSQQSASATGEFGELILPKDPMVPVNLRVPQSLLERLDESAALLNRDRSDCIRSAITRFLDSGPQSVEDRLADLERRLSAVERGER